MAPYLHVLDGRLRIKLVDLKGHTVRARQVEERLGALPGVNLVTANPITGNVLVLYDPERSGTDSLLEALRGWGHLRDEATLPGGMHALGATLLRATAEAALQQLITALLVV